ncbi:MAG: hypothetical protein CVT99_01905 [Bacteroidetes bacterium HGW-Bacteroidetes-16]|jgi:hypothetical protein|nr:MAG: hypothetical protein CVT99_01905 [Bacteroidetes bacterium HGW-Bacteroidetes-16]
MKQLFFILLWFPLLLFAQVSDDFSDGNFTENPVWTGDQNKFVVNDNFQLQLMDTAAGASMLATANQFVGETEWRCFIRLAFSPSSNNNGRFYLISNQQDMHLPLQGYFLQLGESGSSDALEIFRQDGESVTSVCRGTEGLIASSFSIRVKITKSTDGLWKMYVDPQGGENFQLETQGTDNTFQQTNALGFLCIYTVSNDDNFYFDDVYAGPVIVDNTPPVWLTTSVTSDSTLLLGFDESLNAASVATLSNYEANNGIGTPASTELVTGNPTNIQLVFSQKFPSGQMNRLSVSGIRDLAENLMDPGSQDFVFYRAQAGDVVINEIMADPNPVVALPDFEYLELYNLTENLIDLTNWTLTIGTTVKTFDFVVIPANGYLIVSKEEAEPEFTSYGLFYGFSSLALTNAGQTVTLANNEGMLINQVTYSDDWYKDPDKEDGGWSLEQMNPGNYCSGSENWHASENSPGGTPGTQNSVFNDQMLFPAPLKLVILADNILQLTFNQMMDETELQVKSNYEVDGGIGNPQYTYLVVDDSRKIELYFADGFINGKLYGLTAKRNLTNCAGIPMKSDTTISFGLPEIIGTQDIVINELLFNPWTDGVDYVELYNRSQKVLDLGALLLGTIKQSPPNPPDTLYYPILSEQQLMIPGEYLVLTVSPDVVKKQYYTQNPEAFLKVEPFPAFNNDSGTVQITTSENLLVDELKYNENMQYPLLSYLDGVALERINPHVSSNQTNNWHSASESVGFGTPGYLNSQDVSQQVEDKSIQIVPEIFSPDNDGYQDVLNIMYTFDEPGYMMTVKIFNAGGYTVRKLVNNQYLGTSGMVSWDGIQDDHSKAPVGIYVFYVEVFDLNGNVKKYKKVGVLAIKL